MAKETVGLKEKSKNTMKETGKSLLEEDTLVEVPEDYKVVLESIIGKIKDAQTRALIVVNQSLLMYIGILVRRFMSNSRCLNGDLLLSNNYLTIFKNHFPV